MKLSEIALLELLKGNPFDFSSSLNPYQIANLFINSAYLVSAMEFIKEELWLKNREDKQFETSTSYDAFLITLFGDDLQVITFLQEFLITSGAGNIKKISQQSQKVEALVLEFIIKQSAEDQKLFAIQSLRRMSILFVQEEIQQQRQSQSMGHKGVRLYRTFDNLDLVFNLNYQSDKEMIVDYAVRERLYQGSGVGVQSGYSSILLALHSLDVKPGAAVVDLGSGYGRVGIVCSLLRPDIFFTGYEYVPHRVKISNNASRLFGLQMGLNFEAQDLSLESFAIPDADVYYLYDPFTKETYLHVLRQIVEISQHKKITIVTKGNARNWLTDIGNENNWPLPQSFDHGNLCIFRSWES